jgi:hypothetical protein
VHPYQVRCCKCPCESLPPHRLTSTLGIVYSPSTATSFRPHMREWEPHFFSAKWFLAIRFSTSL